MIIRSVQKKDFKEWERMRNNLWPAEEGEHSKVIDSFFYGKCSNPLEVFIALNESGDAVGFAELSIRSFAEGCETDNIAYLEGWYVDEQYRKKGIGKTLINSCENWAREKGCTEFASDTNIENKISISAHNSFGFEQVSQVICFRKKLDV